MSHSCPPCAFSRQYWRCWRVHLILSKSSFPWLCVLYTSLFSVGSYIPTSFPNTLSIQSHFYFLLTTKIMPCYLAQALPSGTDQTLDHGLPLGCPIHLVWRHNFCSPWALSFHSHLWKLLHELGVSILWEPTQPSLSGRFIRRKVTMYDPGPLSAGLGQPWKWLLTPP